jgi:hypothetical protein
VSGTTAPAFITLVDRSNPELIYGFFEVGDAASDPGEIAGEIPFAAVGQREACLVAYTPAEAGEDTPLIGSSVAVALEHEPQGAVCESNYAPPENFTVRSPSPFEEVSSDIPVEVVAEAQGATFDVEVSDVTGQTIGGGEITQEGEVAEGEVAADAGGMPACVSISYTPPGGTLIAVARIPVQITD